MFKKLVSLLNTFWRSIYLSEPSIWTLVCFFSHKNHNVYVRDVSNLRIIGIIKFCLYYSFSQFEKNSREIFVSSEKLWEEDKSPEFEISWRVIGLWNSSHKMDNIMYIQTKACWRLKSLDAIQVSFKKIE